MIDFFTKLDFYIDYRNSYSLRKAFSTLDREFHIAVSRNNQAHARAVIDAAKKVLDKLNRTYRESEDYGETMGYFQKKISQQARQFIAQLIRKLKTDFGVRDYEKEIEQTIAELE